MKCSVTVQTFAARFNNSLPPFWYPRRSTPIDSTVGTSTASTNKKPFSITHLSPPKHTVINSSRFDDAAFEIPCEGFSLKISQHQVLHTLDQQKLIYQDGAAVARELNLWARRMVPSALCSNFWEILWVGTCKSKDICPKAIATVFAPGGHPLNAMWYKPELPERNKGAMTLSAQQQNAEPNSGSSGSVSDKKSEILQSIMSSSSSAYSKSIESLSAGPSTFVTGQPPPNLLEGDHARMFGGRRKTQADGTDAYYDKLKGGNYKQADQWEVDGANDMRNALVNSLTKESLEREAKRGRLSEGSHGTAPPHRMGTHMDMSGMDVQGGVDINEDDKSDLMKPRGSVFAYESPTAEKRVRDTLYFKALCAENLPECRSCGKACPEGGFITTHAYDHQDIQCNLIEDRLTQEVLANKAMNLQMGAATELSAEEFFDNHYIQTLPGFDPTNARAMARDPLKHLSPSGNPADMYPGWHEKGTHYMREHYQFKFGSKGDKEKARA